MKPINDMIRIVIEGDPVPKKRHRCMCIGKHARAYDVQSKKETPEVKDRMLKAWNECYGNICMNTAQAAARVFQAKSLTVNFHFYLPVAKSESEKIRNQKFWGLIEANGKPDFDNLIKFYCDCANGVLWNDDKMITMGKFFKNYDENPRTEMEIMSNKEFMVDKHSEGVLSLISPSGLKEFLKDVDYFKHYNSQMVEMALSQNDRQDKGTTLSTISISLSDFALKYADLLQKIKKLRCKTGEIHA